MRILITGGYGLLGSRLGKYLFDQNHEILFNLEKCNNILGIERSKIEMKDIFNKLSIKVKNNGKDFNCIVPLYRNDLERDVDLYEEIARIYS